MRGWLTELLTFALVTVPRWYRTVRDEMRGSWMSPAWIAERQRMRKLD